MFDSLLGSKFSKKCKYCVKCINSRVVLIRRKKQATVKFLKKDVADLLANGHDSNAFGRIDALMVEINHTSCYDMIEKYCQCILDQLSRLQKQRECPEESTEAVATLIFATARFSDLPELSDLRRVFTERYGSHMESYMNAEFVEKLQKKSFSTDSKIKLMQDIAEEFSVRWDSKAFRQRQTNPPASSSNHSKSSDKSNGQRLHAEITPRNTSVSQRNEAGSNAAGQADGRSRAVAGSANRIKEAMFNADVASNERYRAVLNAGGSFNGRKEVVIDTDIAVNGRAESLISSGTAVNGRDRAPLNSSSFKGRKEVVLDAGGSYNGRTEVALNADNEMVIDSAFGVNRRNGAVSNAGADQYLPSNVKWETPRARFLQRQQVQPESRDIHLTPSMGNVRSHHPAGRTRKVYAAAKETENVEPGCGSAEGYAYVKVSPNNTHKDDCFEPKASLNGIHKDARGRSPTAQEAPGLDDLEKQSVAPLSNISRDMKVVNMIPPYTKLKGFTNGSDVTADYVPAYDDLPRAEKVLEPTGTVHEGTTLPVKNSRGDARPMNMIPPPYTKPNFKKPSMTSDDNKFTDVPISAADYEMSNGGEKGRPVSVRRRLPKPPSVVETNSSTDKAKPSDDDSYGEAIVELYPRKAEEEMGGRRKHGGRRSATKYDGVCDEEAAMDRLLVHYSKKGMNTDSTKGRARTRAHPEELVADSERGGMQHYEDWVQHGNGRNIHHSATETTGHRPERVASLRTIPVIEVGASRGPARATSMHPDLMSPNRALLHPRLSNYDDLTARFIALKNS